MFKPGDYVRLININEVTVELIKPIIVLGINQIENYILVRHVETRHSRCLREKLPEWLRGYKDSYIPNIEDYLNDYVEWYRTVAFAKANPITINLPNNIVRQAYIEPELDSTFDIEGVGNVVITEMSQDKQTAWAEMV